MGASTRRMPEGTPTICNVYIHISMCMCVYMYISIDKEYEERLGVFLKIQYGFF